VGKRNQVSAEAEMRKRKKAELAALRIEKQAEIDRLQAEYDSLLKVRAGQETLILIKPKTTNPKLQTPKLKPYALWPTHQTLSPVPYTLYPLPYTLYPTLALYPTHYLCISVP